jgi:hypothetical protein
VVTEKEGGAICHTCNRVLKNDRLALKNERKE